MIKNFIKNKKLPKVKALYFDGYNLEEVKNFVGKSFLYENTHDDGHGRDITSYLELQHYNEMETIRVECNDYIIRTELGAFIACKSEIFLELYDEVIE